MTAPWELHGAGCGGALLDTSPWQDCRRLPLRGEAHVRAICGLQHVYATAERQRGPAVDLIAAPVMLADPYGGRPA
jgi:hypothetical protein